MATLAARLRRLHIGTHSGGIHIELKELLLAAGEKEDSFPRRSRDHFFLKKTPHRASARWNRLDESVLTGLVFFWR